MKLQLIRLGETLDTLERLKGDVGITPPLRYHLSCIYDVMQRTSETLAPLLTGEWEHDKWIEGAQSLEFAGLTVAELEELPDMTPNEFRVLLRLTTN